VGKWGQCYLMCEFEDDQWWVVTMDGGRLPERHNLYVHSVMLGEEGWQLVSTTSTPDGRLHLAFQMPVSSLFAQA
jgi:hypothetical protein